MGIDLGGIGKGYGVDRAVAALRSWGIQNALVNVGGDLYALGVSEDGDPWKVGVRSPDDPNGLATTLTMSDRAVATSGDYQQFFVYGGRRYHHLLDPRTGAPSQARVRSVTVASESCMAADAGATTAFVASVEVAQKAFPRVAPGSEVIYTV
jgi:thiamine biosynthesis lipoprotein